GAGPALATVGRDSAAARAEATRKLAVFIVFIGFLLTCRVRTLAHCVAAYASAALCAGSVWSVLHPSSSDFYFLRRCTLAKDARRQKQFAHNPPTALGRVRRMRMASAAVRCILKND